MSYEGDNLSPEGWDNDIDAIVPANHPVASTWRVLVMPVRPRKVSKGGIVIPDEAQKAQSYLNYVGRVVSVGPLAWTGKSFAGMDRVPKVGDFIVYGRYAGQPIEHRGVKFLFINDEDLLGFVSDPEELKIYI